LSGNCKHRQKALKRKFVKLFDIKSMSDSVEHGSDITFDGHLKDIMKARNRTSDFGAFALEHALNSNRIVQLDQSHGAEVDALKRTDPGRTSKSAKEEERQRIATR
jgi:hypothetical protein